MKATFHREGLLSAFQLAGSAVASRDVKPILQNLKAIVDGERCTLMATDLELGIRLDVRGIKAEEPGEAILPASRMIAILRESTDDELKIDANAERCEVHGKQNEFEMSSDDPANFPDVPVFGDEKYHELKAGALKEMIRRTLFSAAVENPRYAMNGVLWELEGTTARLVATDGRRLAVCTGQAGSKGGQDTKGATHVVPKNAMNLLERVLQDPEEVVQVSLKPNEVLFKTERATVYSRLVEGRYPAYREVFPKKTTAKVALSTGPFYSAVRQSAIMTDDDSKRVMFTFTKGKLTLQARGQETGRSKVEVPVEYDGKELKISFDPRFLTEMLRVLDSEAPLTLELVDGNSPALFKSGDDYSYVVMPLM
jgi:DNA polymerase-3 subunit beta